MPKKKRQIDDLFPPTKGEHGFEPGGWLELRAHILGKALALSEVANVNERAAKGIILTYEKLLKKGINFSIMDAVSVIKELEKEK